MVTRFHLSPFHTCARARVTPINVNASPSVTLVEKTGAGTGEKRHVSTPTLHNGAVAPLRTEIYTTIEFSW